LERKSYYDILRIARDATPARVKSAFHEFSLLYHPDRYVDSPREVGAVATEIYKRGVEAYGCLSRRPMRDRYDRALARGRLRLEATRASTVPPPLPMRTLEMVARTPRAKQHAVKAERLITAGKLEDARVHLVSALQCEPNNEELAERLQILYEALALEPL
ncbi:MAG TPA: DnaJ domain-containing protein, partial [Polyangiaceae bacterium]